MRILSLILAYAVFLAGILQMPGAVLSLENGTLTYVICQGGTLSTVEVQDPDDGPQQGGFRTLCDVCLNQLQALPVAEALAEPDGPEQDAQASPVPVSHSPSDVGCGSLGPRAPPLAV